MLLPRRETLGTLPKTRNKWNNDALTAELIWDQTKMLRR